jgi:hypothetical protein
MQQTNLQTKHLPQIERGSRRMSARVEHASVGRGSCRAGSNRAEAPPERRPTVPALVGRGADRAGSIQGKAPRERRPTVLAALLVFALCFAARAQVNTGSDGSDGPLDYSSVTNATNVVIDMHFHPNGVYQYTYVNIPTNVTVSFIPNANNTPVVWLVQTNIVINGTVDLSGESPSGNAGGLGGRGDTVAAQVVHLLRRAKVQAADWLAQLLSMVGTVLTEHLEVRLEEHLSRDQRMETTFLFH